MYKYILDPLYMVTGLLEYGILPMKTSFQVDISFFNYISFINKKGLCPILMKHLDISLSNKYLANE